MWKNALLGFVFLPPPPAILPLPDRGRVVWECDFEDTRCDMVEQSKTEPVPRSFFVAPARSGRYAIALVTQPGDDQVHDSGDWERNDMLLPPSPDYCNEGQEEWWAVSVLFPDLYVESELGTVMDFHHDGSGGLANFHVMVAGNQLEFVGFFGDVENPEYYYASVGTIVRNTWYDFVYHVKWTAGDGGWMTAWVNGKKMLSHQGPTLYPGIPCYLKLANYHAPTGYASMVVFDRVVRGTSRFAVSLTTLE